jgi:hypothetical protein
MASKCICIWDEQKIETNPRFQKYLENFHEMGIFLSWKTNALEKQNCEHYNSTFYIRRKAALLNIKLLDAYSSSKITTIHYIFLPWRMCYSVHFELLTKLIRLYEVESVVTNLPHLSCISALDLAEKGMQIIKHNLYRPFSDAFS